VGRTAAITLGAEPISHPRMCVLDIFRERLEETRLDEAMAWHIMQTGARLVFVEEGIYERAAAARDLLRVQAMLPAQRYLVNIATGRPRDKVTRARRIDGRC
jgi:hypothetical protein